MKKVLSMLLALVMVFALCATASADKAPEEYTGNLVIYSPHDADPLAAGVALFEKTYPNITVEVIAAGTG